MALKKQSGRPPRRRRVQRFKIKHDSIANLQADLVRLVRGREGLSRVELARCLNLAPSTVGIHVDHLTEEGFLSESKRVRRDFGRPPTALRLNAQGGRFIGVDFEARNILATAVDFSQEPIKQCHDTITAADSVEQILEKIERAICEVMAEDERPVLGIGLGVPGAIDPVHGIARSYKHIRGWNNIPLAARFSQRFQTPIYLENNIRSMALAELWFGQGRGLKDFICLGVRSGIGAGVIIDGQVYRGSNNLAGEIGDWPCVLTTDASGPCKFATLEEIASLRGIQAVLAGGGYRANGVAPDREFSLLHLLQGAQDNDPAVLKLLDKVARTLGLILSQLNRAFNPGKVIMAGAFTVFGDIFLDRLKRSFEEFSPRSELPQLVNSNLGEFNGALGAAALAVHQWKPAPKKG